MSGTSRKRGAPHSWRRHVSALFGSRGRDEAAKASAAATTICSPFSSECGAVAPARVLIVLDSDDDGKDNIAGDLTEMSCSSAPGLLSIAAEHHCTTRTDVLSYTNGDELEGPLQQRGCMVGFMDRTASRQAFAVSTAGSVSEPQLDLQEHPQKGQSQAAATFMDVLPSTFAGSGSQVSSGSAVRVGSDVSVRGPAAAAVVATAVENDVVACLLEALRAENTQLRNRLSTTVDELADRVDEVEGLRAQMDAASAAAAAAAASAVAAAAERDAAVLRTENEQLREQLAAMAERLANHIDELEGLRAQMDAASAAAAATAASAVAAAAERDAAVLRTENEQLQEQLAATAERLADREDHLRRLQTQLEDLDEARTLYRRQLTNHLSDLNYLEDNLEDDLQLPLPPVPPAIQRHVPVSGSTATDTAFGDIKNGRPNGRQEPPAAMLRIATIDPAGHGAAAGSPYGGGATDMPWCGADARPRTGGPLLMQCLLPMTYTIPARKTLGSGGRGGGGGGGGGCTEKYGLHAALPAAHQLTPQALLQSRLLLLPTGQLPPAPLPHSSPSATSTGLPMSYDSAFSRPSGAAAAAAAAAAAMVRMAATKAAAAAEPATFSGIASSAAASTAPPSPPQSVCSGEEKFPSDQCPLASEASCGSTLSGSSSPTSVSTSRPGTGTSSPSEGASLELNPMGPDGSSSYSGIADKTAADQAVPLGAAAAAGASVAAECGASKLGFEVTLAGTMTSPSRSWLPGALQQQKHSTGSGTCYSWRRWRPLVSPAAATGARRALYLGPGLSNETSAVQNYDCEGGAYELPAVESAAAAVAAQP